MKKTKWTASPYLVWMAAFIAVPLAIVVYFAFTDKAGHFTDFLGFVNRSVQNGVDNSARIFQRNTFSCSVPTGVHQISFRVVLVHFFNQTLSIHRGVKC